MDAEVFGNAEYANLLAKAIVDTVREPLLVLDRELRVVLGSRSFYRAFQIAPNAIDGHKLYDIDEGVWNIPQLQLILERIGPDHGVMEDFSVEREFPRIGHRSMLLNARKVFYEGNGHTTILLGLEDATERRESERALQKLLKQQEMLVAEMSHRVANSLQLIASILMLKAKSVESAETRLHLEDAHRRVMSVATMQEHLQASKKGEQVAIGPYLSKLCETLAASMIGDNRAISLKVVASEGAMVSGEAVSIGLLVTELVINAVKHAFPASVSAGHIVVGYEMAGTNWKLSVSDSGIGMPDRPLVHKKGGLGTSLMKALAQQLDAQVEVASSPKGTTVSITHATFVSRLPTAD